MSIKSAKQYHQDSGYQSSESTTLPPPGYADIIQSGHNYSQSVSDYEPRADDRQFPTQSYSLLHKPIVIPQMNNNFGSPFSRAYSPALQPFNLSRVEFMDIVDELNTLYRQSNNSMVDDGLPFSRLRQLGSIATDLARGNSNGNLMNERNLFLNKCNEQIFHPRKLKIMVCTTQDLLNVLDPASRNGITINDIAEYSLQQSYGTDRMTTLSYYVSPLIIDGSYAPPNNQMSGLSGGLSRLPTSIGQARMMLRNGLDEGFGNRGGGLGNFRRNDRRDSKDIRKAEREMEKATRKAERELEKVGRRNDRDFYRRSGGYGPEYGAGYGPSYGPSYGTGYGPDYQYLQQQREMQMMQDDMMRMDMNPRMSRYGGNMGGRRMDGMGPGDNIEDLRWLVVVSL